MNRLSGYNLYRIRDTTSNPKCLINHILVDYFTTFQRARHDLDQHRSHNPLNKYVVFSAFAGEDSQGIHSERGER